MLTRKFLIAGAAAIAMGVAVTAVASPAQAQWRRGHHGGWGAGVAAGVAGGVLLGTALAARPYYYGGYEPLYAAPVEGECWRERQPVYDQLGNVVGSRLVRVCE